jgi:hypothetical protein
MDRTISRKGYDQVKEGDRSFGPRWFSMGGEDRWFVGEAARILSRNTNQRHDDV